MLVSSEKHTNFEVHLNKLFLVKAGKEKKHENRSLKNTFFSCLQSANPKKNPVLKYSAHSPTALLCQHIHEHSKLIPAVHGAAGGAAAIFHDGVSVMPLLPQDEVLPNFQARYSNATNFFFLPLNVHISYYQSK